MRTTLLIAVAAAAIFGINGCAVTPSAPAVVKVISDPFSPLTAFEGPRVFLKEQGADNYGLFNIRSWVEKKSGRVTHQLYAELHYAGQWHFYQTANDDRAKPLELSKIDAHVVDCSGYCSYVETVGVDLGDSQLREASETGYSVKIYAKSGDTAVMTLTPQWIQLQLKAIADFQQPAPAK